MSVHVMVASINHFCVDESLRSRSFEMLVSRFLQVFETKFAMSLLTVFVFMKLIRSTKLVMSLC